mgnify:CR=1 FL=1
MISLTLFSNQNTAHLLELFIWMLGAFLIGYFFARWYYKKKCEESKNIYSIKPEKTSNNIDIASSVKATKTMDRGGIQVKQEGLNFNSFGKATADEKDDLKKIKGVGPFIEEKLNNIGIYTYKQISKFTIEDIEDVTNLIEFFPGRMLRDDWKEQAKILMEGGETDFSKRVDKGDVDYK